MYHRVLRSPLQESVFVQPGMYVTIDAFQRHADFIKNRFHALPLPELIQRIKSGLSVEGCCAITFDDGWQDNFTNAFPVLKEFQLPFTIFLTTDFIGTRRIFWPEEVSFYLRQPKVVFAARQCQVLDRIIRKFAEDGNEESFLETAVMKLKNCSQHERDEVLDQLRSASITQPPERQMMKWEEVKEMQASGLVSVGAHTANHVILTQVSQGEAENEIIRSRRELENRMGVCPEFFAYPNGDFTNDLQAMLERNGFTGAVTTRKGWFGEGVNLFEIPRIGMHEDVCSTVPLFLARILLNRF